LIESLTLEFDSNAFTLSAVQKACYRFTNVASFEIRLETQNSKTAILVVATNLGSKSVAGLDHLKKLIRNEALDQQLREQISAETQDVRNLILAHAFSKTGLIAPDGAPPAI